MGCHWFGLDIPTCILSSLGARTVHYPWSDDDVAKNQSVEWWDFANQHTEVVIFLVSFFWFNFMTLTFTFYYLTVCHIGNLPTYVPMYLNVYLFNIASLLHITSLNHKDCTKKNQQAHQSTNDLKEVASSHLWPNFMACSSSAVDWKRLTMTTKILYLPTTLNLNNTCLKPLFPSYGSLGEKNDNKTKIRTNVVFGEFL